MTNQRELETGDFDAASCKMGFGFPESWDLVPLTYPVIKVYLLYTAKDLSIVSNTDVPR